MTRLRCQETRRTVRRIAACASIINALIPLSVAHAQNSSQAVQTARSFFDALDAGDVPTLARYWAGDLNGLRAVLPGRSRNFGRRWIGDRGPREVIYAQGRGSSQTVALKARYERATLSQTAYVSCTPTQCRVTGYREAPAS